MRICPLALITAMPLLFSSGSWSADFQTGQDAYSSGDYETALAEWQPLAEEGDANSQFGMGLLHANGFGVPFDNDQALKWYTSAAEQGHGEAQCNIGVMHANGWGVPQSDADAFKWFTMSAELGVLQAQTSLAKMYAKGFGAPKDNVQAYKWYSIATELGDYGAPFKRDELAAKMSEEEIAQSGQLVSDWVGSHSSMLADQ